MKVYVVKHMFETDGGYGDAIGEEEVIGIFSSKEKAEEVVNKFSNPHVYYRPYEDLHCGELTIEEYAIDEKIISIAYSKMFGHAEIIKENE